MKTRYILSVILMASIFISGCAVDEVKVAEINKLPLIIGNPELPYPPSVEPQVGDILHLPTGLYVGQQQMLNAVSDQRMVYVGETHDSPAAHRFQLMVLKAMAARHPDKVALGMEVFIPAQQPAIDRWMAGELDEPGFLREAEWYRVWRADFAYYRDLLNFARDNDIPIRALNATKELVRAIGSKLPEELTEEQRQQLPDMSFIDDYQQAMVDAVFSGHGPGGNHAEGFKRVQTLWDQTMAENIVDYLQSPLGEGKRMMVVAGGHHVRYGYGIPRRVFNLMPSSYNVVGTREIVIPEEKQDQLMDITMPRFPMVAYDYVKHVVYETLPNTGVKLGIMFSSVEAGLQVNQVMPDSNAAMAALLVEDVITHIDGIVMTDMYDIKHLLKQKNIGDSVDISLLRAGVKAQVAVIFNK